MLLPLRHAMPILIQSSPRNEAQQMFNCAHFLPAEIELSSTYMPLYFANVVQEFFFHFIQSIRSMWKASSSHSFLNKFSLPAELTYFAAIFMSEILIFHTLQHYLLSNATLFVTKHPPNYKHSSPSFSSIFYQYKKKLNRSPDNFSKLAAVGASIPVKIKENVK